MAAWSFRHSEETGASREAAWRFWTDVDNWPHVDPDVVWVRLDGPFVAGAMGTTKPRGVEPTAWRITELEPPARAAIEIAAPGAVLRCVWEFEPLAGGGTRITQTVELDGAKAREYVAAGEGLKDGIPAGMAKLAAAMDRVAAPGLPS